MPISETDILNVRHLSAGYGKRQVLFDVSFAVKQGENVLLIGGTSINCMIKSSLDVLP
ncbi:MAG: hypothetical protein NTV43_09280 [Methylococcales bacterium]|nr:hypothetical protein [Methylococcales bacterium]